MVSGDGTLRKSSYSPRIIYAYNWLKNTQSKKSDSLAGFSKNIWRRCYGSTGADAGSPRATGSTGSRFDSCPLNTQILDMGNGGKARRSAPLASREGGKAIMANSTTVRNRVLIEGETPAFFKT